MSNHKRLLVDAIIVVIALAAGAGTIYAVQAETASTCSIQSTFYQDADGDGYGWAASSTQACEAPAGYVANNTDCNDSLSSIHPGATENCNGIDDNCDGQYDDGMTNFQFWRDFDGDNFGDIASSTFACVKPSGYSATSTDCNDRMASVNPDATELCDLIDNDCDGTVDDNAVKITLYLDADGDGFGTSASTTQGCYSGSGYATTSNDCNDSSASVNPNAAESCNGIDDNCNGTVDENCAANVWYRDLDGDGYGNPSISTSTAVKPSGYVENNTDCNDSNAAMRPGNTEVADGLDNDCDGQIDEGLQVYTWYRDADGDGYGTSTNTIASTTKPSGYVPVNSDCNDTNSAIKPGATEVADGIDNNCNGLIDENIATWYRDADGDGYGNGDVATTSASQPSGYVSNSGDCNDSNYNVRPNANEVTDGIDNDCDGQVDENCSSTVWYRDADGDGYGNSSLTTYACGQPSGYVSNANDCNDSNSSIKPGATETKDGIDNDCDGQIDEGTSGSGCQNCDCHCDCDCDCDQKAGVTCRWDNSIQFSNHGAFASAWSHYTNCLKSIGQLSGREKGQMMKEANQVMKGRVGALREEIRDVRSDLSDVREELGDRNGNNGKGNEKKNNGNGKGKGKNK